jgi:PAS domain S-box-containing protein
VTSWNRGAERLFGYTEAEMIGRSLSVLVPPERSDDLPRILDAIRRGERVDHFETERVRKDGERLHVSVTVSPIRDSSGRIIGASKIARDVTERKRAEEERKQLLEAEQKARRDAEAASRAKDDFLATVSHELRTPLSPILTWTRILKTGGLDADKARRALDSIERSARTQAQLVEDLLDISRIISGKLRLDVRPVRLATVIDAAIEVIRPAADAKGVELQVILDRDVGPVSGDAERLQQVVWNLLSNAVKFTPKDGRVTVLLERDNEDLRVTVRDTGTGIRPEFLPHVFERFRQADIGPTRAHGGLGLGLAIVRHMVEAHGGTVEVESEGEGRGTAFSVRLPLLRPRAPETSDRRDRTRPANDPFPSLAGVSLLVVDDEPDSNEAVRELLALCGADVRVAGSAKHAREILRRWKPDVLVSDVAMPGEDGYAFIADLRSHNGDAAQLPALALTAYASRSDKIRLLAAGFQAHVSKPLDPTELIRVVLSLARPSERV